MKIIGLTITAMLLSNLLFAGEHAHEHGALKLDIAVEGKTLQLDIDGPAESFIGFEHVAKTEQEKTIFTAAQVLWTKDLLTKLFVLDKKLGCSISEAVFVQEIEKQENHSNKETGIHSDIEAQATITCLQNLSGEMIQVGLKKFYPHIKKLTIDLVGSTTKTINVKNAVEQIKL